MPGHRAGPAEVRVFLETRHGLLVEALVDAGFTVLPVNPDLMARLRGPAKKKDDAAPCNAMPALHRSRDAPGAASTSWPAAWPTTATSATPYTSGPLQPATIRLARQFYEAKIAAGKGHHGALRSLGNRWLEILWHCLRLGVTDDEHLHTANRERHLALAA